MSTSTANLEYRLDILDNCSATKCRRAQDSSQECKRRQPQLIEFEPGEDTCNTCTDNHDIKVRRWIKRLGSDSRPQSHLFTYHRAVLGWNFHTCGQAHRGLENLVTWWACRFLASEVRWQQPCGQPFNLRAVSEVRNRFRIIRQVSHNCSKGTSVSTFKEGCRDQCV